MKITMILFLLFLFFRSNSCQGALDWKYS